MIGLVQGLVTLGFQWNLKRKFSLAIWRKHRSHLNLPKFITQTFTTSSKANVSLIIKIQKMTKFYVKLSFSKSKKKQPKKS